jgi:hypothetical protein
VTYEVILPFNGLANDLTVVEVNCEPGDIALSGGFNVDLWDMVIDRTFRKATGDGWTIGIFSYESIEYEIYAHVVCADVTP